MPLVFEKTFDQLQAEVMDELSSSTNITRITPGSKARTIVQAFNRKLNKSYQDFDINFLRSFLPFAQGRFLEYLGDMLGVPRNGSSRAIVPEAAQQIKFFVESGTFGDLNNGNDIFIPTDVQISTLPNNEGVVYRLSGGITLPASASEQYFSAEAIRDGTTSNVGAGTLVYTTFNSYAAGTGLKVTNPEIIITGQDIETEANYKFRISNQVLAAEKGNETAVRLALLVVPGVSNIVTRPYARGIGTFDFLIQTIVPNTPQVIIQACQAAINQVESFGLNGRALSPRLTGLTFKVSITWRGDTSASDRTQIKTAISNALQDYVNNLEIGEQFILNKAESVIMNVSNKIKNIGTSIDPIDEIAIYKESKLKDNKVKKTLIGDYTPSEDERIIIEPSVENPIILIDLN